MSLKRNRNKKRWARKRRAGKAPKPPARRTPDSPDAVRKALRPPRLAKAEPSELDQIGVLIVEEQLGLQPTPLEGLRSIAASLPFEPCVSLLALLAGRVENTLNSSAKQISIAESFFGASELVERYRARTQEDASARIFGPQSLYTLMRILAEDAYDAPITRELSDEERFRLIAAVVASNSAVVRGTDASVGPSADDLLAYELQIGSYYNRPSWMEEMARARELYCLATDDRDLQQSPDWEPVQEWIERSGLSSSDQWLLGFGLGAVANAWDPSKHPHIPEKSVDEVLRKTGLDSNRAAALDVISADRATLRDAFATLEASGKRFIWELRPFNTSPFLRLQGQHGLLLLGRPWILSWLGEGFHYRAMRAAQRDDETKADGRANHVQRYTAFAGQVFEQYCLRLASEGLPPPARVMGEQPYGKGGGKATSDIAVAVGGDLVLFEANARRLGAEPLLTGDPLDASAEITKLVVKKINQLGVVIGALLSGEASLPEGDIEAVERIFPVVVAAGHLWQTTNLWSYLERERDAEKCASLLDPRVQPLQLLDPGDYERVLAVAHHGTSMAELLARKASGPYRHRDLAVWFAEDRRAPDHKVRLPAIEKTFESMTSELVVKLGTPEK